MAKDLPLNTDSMVQGMGYFKPDAPTTDAADGLGAVSSEMPTVPYHTSDGVQAVSLATQSDTAPEAGSFLQSNLHQDYWCDPLLPNVGTPER